MHVFNDDNRLGYRLLIPLWYEGRVNQTLAPEEWLGFSSRF
jgi:hypothetical protein